jgi:hypothetical protein
MAYHVFHNFRIPSRHLVAQVAVQAEMAFREVVPLVLLEVQQLLCASSVSGDSELYDFGMEGSWPYDSCKPLPGDSRSQALSCDAQQSLLLVSSLLGLRRKVS